jgi:hypothetical protein
MAIAGDIVAVKILPESEWSHPSKHLVEEEVNNIENIPDDINLPAAQPPTKPPPCGVVVGVVKRNWRSYCGALQPSSRYCAGSGDAVCKGCVLWCSGGRHVPGQTFAQGRSIAAVCRGGPQHTEDTHSDAPGSRPCGEAPRMCNAAVLRLPPPSDRAFTAAVNSTSTPDRW